MSAIPGQEYWYIGKGRRAQKEAEVRLLSETPATCRPAERARAAARDKSTGMLSRDGMRS